MASIEPRSDEYTWRGREYKTFKRWSELGYRIKKGSKADNRLYGVPVFSEEQVERPPWYGRARSSYRSWMNHNIGHDGAYELDGWVEAFPGADGWGSG